MKIDYTAADAANLERGFFALPDNNTRAARSVRAAYVAALRACGVQCAHIERGKVHALRVFAPDGQGFIKKGRRKMV
jgi:hypothetical protein